MDGSSGERFPPSRSRLLPLEVLEERVLPSGFTPSHDSLGPFPVPHALIPEVPGAIRIDGRVDPARTPQAASLAGPVRPATDPLIPDPAVQSGGQDYHGWVERIRERQQRADAGPASEVIPGGDRAAGVLPSDGGERNRQGPGPSTQEGPVQSPGMSQPPATHPFTPSGEGMGPAVTALPGRSEFSDEPPEVVSILPVLRVPRGHAAGRAVKPPPLGGGETAPPLLPAETPLAGVLPFDQEALERGVDAFFIRLAHLGDDWSDPRSVAEIASWMTVTTAVALEIVRLRNQKARWQPGADEDAVLGLTVLLPEDEA